MLCEGKIPADGVVLGLVRGGVPVAYEVARGCRLPLDIMAVRKLGMPGQEELALGAVASGGAIVWNENILRSCRIAEEILQQLIERETRELERRESLYREGHPPLEIAGKAVMLVDDGLATGASMRAAIRAVKEKARQVIVAVPVGAPSTCAELAEEADRVVCPLLPEPLDAVSMFYRDFEPTSDQEVMRLLRETRESSPY